MMNSDPNDAARAQSLTAGDPRKSPPATVIRLLRMTWSEGFLLNRHKANWGHFIIDRRTPEFTAESVARYYGDKRDVERIRAALLIYFQALKLETN